MFGRHAGEAEDLRPKQLAPWPERMRAAVLDNEIGISGEALHRHVANHIARRGSGRAKGQPDGITGKVARQQQVALGVEAVEQRLAG